jgi:flagellar L-ring protein precursor FlgH
MTERTTVNLLLALLVAAVITSLPAEAESIWKKRTARAGFLYRDNVASELGDSLTVLIADQSSFRLEGKREMEKITAHTGSVNLTATPIELHVPAGSLEQSSSRTIEGSDDYTGTRQFTDSITVTVHDRLPNGNLVIAGRSERFIAGEEVTTILNGIVRPEDISGGNSISSRLVAHLKIYYQTAGSSDAYVKEGLLNRILSLFWPF